MHFYQVSSPYSYQPSYPVYLHDDDWTPNTYRAPVRPQLQDYWREQQLLESLRQEQERRMWLLEEQRRARRAAWEEEQLRRSLYEHELQQAIRAAAERQRMETETERRKRADAQANKDRMWNQYKNDHHVNKTVASNLSDTTAPDRKTPMNFVWSQDDEGRPVVLFLNNPRDNEPKVERNSPKLLPVSPQPVEKKKPVTVEPRPDPSKPELILAFVDDVNKPSTVLPVSLARDSDDFSLKEVQELLNNFKLKRAPCSKPQNTSKPCETLVEPKIEPKQPQSHARDALRDTNKSSESQRPEMVIRFVNDPYHSNGIVLGYQETNPTEHARDSTGTKSCEKSTVPDRQARASSPVGCADKKSESVTSVSPSVAEISTALAKFAKIVSTAEEAVRIDTKSASPTGSARKDLDAINTQLKLLSSYQTRVDLITTSLDCLQIPKTEEFFTCRELKKHLSARAVASAEEIEKVTRHLQKERARLSNLIEESETTEKPREIPSTDDSCAQQSTSKEETSESSQDRDTRESVHLDEVQGLRQSARSPSPVRHVVLETVEDPDSS